MRAGRPRKGGNGTDEPRGLWKTLRPGDLLVVLAVVVLAVALLSASALTRTAASGAVLLRDGVTLRTFTLAELGRTATYDFESEGYHYTFATGNGAIRFLSADCPDKVCVQTGWVSHPPQVAACVPGHLLIRVLGDSGDVDVNNK